MALVHEYMRIHGGRLEITSELGKGTEAALLFPRYRAIFDVPSRTDGHLPGGRASAENEWAPSKVA